MATNSKASDDNSSTAGATAPPSYDTISTNPIQCSQSSVFSFRRMKQKPPDFTPSSVTSNVNACAAALPAAELSNILTKLNIEGHTALYWAIVNNRPEAFWALKELTSCYSSDCISDLCIACTITSDHEMFTQLNLGSYSEDRRLREFLGCPQDEIQVHTCDGTANQFKVVFQIGMFQKRLRMATEKGLYYEFVAGGHIWWLHFYMPKPPTNGVWHTAIGLSGNLAVRPLLKIPLWTSTKVLTLKSSQSTKGKELGGQVMHNMTEYVDHEGTLHAKLDMTLL
ncbi:hypothetical protein DFJ58DRAFT_744837 [Suillus subalutaceus]|uniref:uncharacterized protein n=1 Tax=Suillus subalutaceus TaxID=48586 RepID=UPI001B86BBC3|nr:uncharacterized protein DFJ58DRAFT_744837 [Suillus subalutaceus]KAG1858795.1 hypothetical protein DFJ58DRAFT_744837 [Suillus subalutaceus]